MSAIPSSLPSRNVNAISRTSSFATTSNAKDSAEQNLQDVFSTVLEQVGREGFASSQSLSSSDNLAEQIGTSWDQWFNTFSTTRYSFVPGSGSPSVQENKTAVDLRQDYKQILVDAYQKGGYVTPKAYVQSLSSDELRTIQQVQHLADSIVADKLTEESSLNLLLPPDTQVDANRDGLTAVGAAYTLRFPDSNTPLNVRDAWNAATAELPEQDRMTYELQMVSQVLFANMHFDSNGQFLRSSQPGDADWINPMSSPNFSYASQANGWLDYLDRFKNQMPVEQYQSDLKFWTAFRDELEKKV